MSKHTYLIPLVFFALSIRISLAGDNGNWPQFRGFHAGGVVDGQNLPNAWSGGDMTNIRWKTLIPGMGHGSPIIWGDKLIVTTSVNKAKNETYLKHGLYGSGDTAEDRREVHLWQVYCLDKKTGAVIWNTTAKEAVPRSGRHIKASYANATPVTDGRYVAAYFGSEGLFVFDMTGRLIWSKDLGVVDVGAYDVPTYEWGAASSPIIYNDMVIVQVDTQKDDFIAAFNLKDGGEVWRTKRDELPSWGSPTIYPGSERVELVTNGSNFICGYDPLTGRELWRLGGSSKITTPTPVFSNDLIIVASGRRPEKPIFAIRAGANGDITLPENAGSSKSIAWSSTGKGPYMPTPIIYGEYLYVLNNNGVFDCYLLQTGESKYRQRIPHVGGGFSASPVAADGKLYLSAEDGEIFVVKTGPTFELLATNPLGEVIMATPAISEGSLYVRARNHVFAIGN